MESPTPMPWVVISFAKCNQQHIEFATAAFIIMTITIITLKMISTAHIFAERKQAIPAYFFFGDARTMSTHVRAIYHDIHTPHTQGNEHFTAMTPAVSTPIAAAPTPFHSAISKYIERIFDQVIVPFVYKYGAM